MISAQRGIWRRRAFSAAKSGDPRPVAPVTAEADQPCCRVMDCCPECVACYALDGCCEECMLCCIEMGCDPFCCFPALAAKAEPQVCKLSAGCTGGSCCK